MEIFSMCWGGGGREGYLHNVSQTILHFNELNFRERQIFNSYSADTDSSSCICHLLLLKALLTCISVCCIKAKALHTSSPYSPISSPVPPSLWCPRWGCSCSCPPALWRTHRGPQRSPGWSAPSGRPGWSWCRAGCSPSAASPPCGEPPLRGREEQRGGGKTDINIWGHSFRSFPPSSRKK